MQMTSADPDDINIADILRAIGRRKLWALAGFLACMLLGIAYLVFKAPVYEARVKLHIGQVAGAGPLELPDILAPRMLAAHGEIVADGVMRPRPFLKHATPVKGVTGVVELVSEADSPQDAVGLLQKVVDDIQETHGEIFARSRGALEERLRNLEARRSALSRQYEGASAFMTQAGQKEPVDASILAMERSRVAELVAALEAEQAALTQRLLRPQTHETGLLGGIAAPRKPASPRLALVLAIAMAAGMVSGVLVALAAESIKSGQGSSGR